MFDYLGVLISVIFGLAITHTISGWSWLVQHRHNVRPYWVQLVWSLNLMFYVLALWWGMFWWKHLQVWTIQEFLFLTGYAIVMFMIASILFPGEMSESSQEDRFFANRQWFFSLLLVAHLIDIPETAAKQVAGVRGIPWQYAFAAPVFLGIAVTGLMTANRRVHSLIAPLWLVTLMSYVVFSSLDRIVAR